MMQKDKRYVAFVCSGNTCRSPMGEGIFNQIALENGLNVCAESFGMATVNGLPVSENSLKACAEKGIDLSNKTSVSVNDAELEKYDKFCCMSQGHARMLNEFYDVPADRIKVLNISDPYGGNEEIYRNCCNEIYNSIKEIIKEYED